MKIQWSPLAVGRIAEIAEYIAQDSPILAEKWIQSIFDRVEQIKNFSQSGRFVPEINRKDIRELIIVNYRIIYRIETHAISILTVRHSRQILPEEDIDNAWK
jgi:plasmid stabilization system protein ParE